MGGILVRHAPTAAGAGMGIGESVAKAFAPEVAVVWVGSLPHPDETQMARLIGETMRAGMALGSAFRDHG